MTDIGQPANTRKRDDTGSDTRHAIVETSLGGLTVVASGDALTGLYFPHHWYLPPVESLGRR
ncbi:hypothetical protein ACFVSQ_38485, partial [Streptomyces niveus]